jgi:hypothetical protein
MPKGTGSLQVRGRTYWMIYTDVAGCKVQANTGTPDLAEARRVLADVAIAILETRLAALREVRDERPHQGHRDAGARGAGKPGPHHSPAAADARNRKTSATRGGN